MHYRLTLKGAYHLFVAEVQLQIKIEVKKIIKNRKMSRPGQHSLNNLVANIGSHFTCLQ